MCVTLLTYSSNFEFAFTVLKFCFGAKFLYDFSTFDMLKTVATEATVKDCKCTMFEIAAFHCANMHTYRCW